MAEERVGFLVRNVTNADGHWITETIEAGTKVYEFKGTTYGCVGPGVAVSLDGPLEYPFIEIPDNAIDWHSCNHLRDVCHVNAHATWAAG